MPSFQGLTWLQTSSGSGTGFRKVHDHDASFRFLIIRLVFAELSRRHFSLKGNRTGTEQLRRREALLGPFMVLPKL